MADVSATTVTHASGTSVCRVALTRPARRNALTFDMLTELTRLARVHHERPLVLVAAGDAFCAGLDLDELRATLERDGSAEAPLVALVSLYDAVRARAAPTGCLVDGPAVGGGCGLVACCDHVSATQRARFALPDGPLMPLAACTLPFLRARARAVPPSMRAFDWDAAAAIRYGLVDRLLDDDDAAEGRLIEATLTAPRLASPADRGQLLQLLQHAVQPAATNAVRRALGPPSS